MNRKLVPRIKSRAHRSLRVAVTATKKGAVDSRSMRTSNINMAVARKERVTPVATQQVDRFDERFRIRLSRPAGICAHHGLEEPSDTHKLEQPAGFGFGLVRADCEPRAMPSQLRELAGHTPIDPGQLSGHCAIAMLIACEERIESIVVSIDTGGKRWSYSAMLSATVRSTRVSTSVPSRSKI
jgi:hypothetical protein